MKNAERELKLIIMPGSAPPTELVQHYEAAYLMWRTVWEEAALEIEDFPKKVFSNDFVRQDEILAVFKGDECTSLGFWTELDMSLITSRQDQYFQSWDDESVSKLTMYGSYIGKYSFFTVAKNFRAWSREVNISLTDLQVGLFGYRLLESNCSAMTGTTRNNRKINFICTRGGAQLLKKDVMQYGSAVDLMAWYRHTAKPFKEIEHLAKELWLNKITYNQPRRTENVSRKQTTFTL